MSRVADDRRRIFGKEEEAKPQHFVVTKWPHALPHYNSQLMQMLTRLPDTVAKVPGLYLTGNYLGAIGLSRILEFNRELAEKIIQENHG